MIKKHASISACFAAVFTHFCVASEPPKIVRDGYSYAEVAGGALAVSDSQGTNNIPDIFNAGSYSYLAFLRRFNDFPAVYYNPVTSRMRSELYYTLKQNNNQTVIDCIYAHFQVEDDGRMTDKAVCGLNANLTSEFNNAFQQYDELWSYRHRLPYDESRKTITVEEGNIRGINITRKYVMDTEGMYYDNPETIISANGKKFSFGGDSVFIVYDSVDLQKPILLQVSKKKSNHEDAFVSYDGDALKLLLAK